MRYHETEHLRVLIANERRDRLALIAPIVAGLGHEVIAREIDIEDVGPVTARERPDVCDRRAGREARLILFPPPACSKALGVPPPPP
jgi:hypothetical protein